MAWKTLCNEVEFLTQYPEVGLAFTDSTSPVPGYLFGEINAITYMNYGSNCKPLVNVLITKLDAHAPLVSMKVLKLLIYLVKNGHTEMVEEIKFHEVVLKEAMAFHGPPDDLHGKAFYENIRKMAKELLEYAFSENKDISQNTTPPPLSELTGYGSSASMSGFGYTAKSQKSVSEKVTEGITTFVEKLLPPEKEMLPDSGSNLAEALPKYKPIMINKSVTDFEETCIDPKPSPVQAPQAVLRSKQKASVYKPGRPGGGWDDSDDDEEEDAIVEITSKESFASADSNEFSKIELKEAVSDWTDERKIVEEFTANEDIRKLSLTNITAFCQRCSSLNCDKVLTLLVEKMSNNEENVQLRSLIFVEYLLFHDIIPFESMVRIVLTPVSLLSEREDASKAFKLKAKKVFLILQNLNKNFQQRQPKPFVETPIKCSS
ncbi:hypothetical protein JTE90_022802 [Oedothorax gibbosus]|uniref:ENTH domain-containing protein n=1 Tax=Oedothorax gibbosus TaxID=931172 RepID=A0AAV6V5H5_9ARAC|nr:hypothetical protein JTE90_022802 [Oedothorax gibbosus]